MTLRVTNENRQLTILGMSEKNYQTREILKLNQS